MILSDKNYQLAKKILTMLVPGIIALITALGGLFGFDTKIINGTLAAVATFAGVALQVFSNNYDKEKEKEETEEK